MKFVFLLIFAASTTFAASTLKERAPKLLPTPLNELITHKTTLSEVEKKIGKAHFIEGSDYFWERDGFKYALKLSFNNKYLLDSIHYTFASEKPSLDKLGKIDTKKLVPYSSNGKETRYMVLKENNLEVVIDPLTKNIYSVKVP